MKHACCACRLRLEENPLKYADQQHLNRKAVNVGARCAPAGLQNRFACDRGRIAAAQIAGDSRASSCGVVERQGENARRLDRRLASASPGASNGWNVRICRSGAENLCDNPTVRATA